MSLRVIAGRFGGRKLEAPRGQRTHPMGDRPKTALFNALGDIEGLTVLDAFAGSGALAIEALSRGAGRALAIEVDKRAQQAVEANIRSLHLEGMMKLIRANASSWSDQNSDELFDIVIAAPPYDDLQPFLVQKLTRHVSPGGLYVLDWPGKKDLPELSSLESIKQLDFGDAQLGFYRRNSG